MKQSVRITLAGQQFTIRSDAGEHYVHELAAYVDAHLQSIHREGRSASLQRLAMLVAIQIADELFREKDLHQRFRFAVEQKLQDLEDALKKHEDHLASTPINEVKLSTQTPKSNPF